ncbi:hypothetical protein F4776DRAFT_437744 [Hypoxylon sp. NC0597]|nr:hypothetical protein F4776DRAFT_437744 [Hypoxylon sp. NC0597]
MLVQGPFNATYIFVPSRYVCPRWREVQSLHLNKLWMDVFTLLVDMQFQSPLFHLPREVRDDIFDFYLAYDHIDFEDTLRPQLVYMGDVPYSRPLPALMITCKSLYQELRPKVHGQAVLRVAVHGWNDRRIGFGVRGILRFDRLEKLWLVVATEHPNWNSWLLFFGEVIKRARNLLALAIDWNPRPVDSVGWVGRVNMKKEDEFFGIVATLEKLQVIQVYGNISSRWPSRLDAITTRPYVVCHRFRWWREPGLD